MAVPEPTILDHAPVDTDKQCPMWTGDEPEPCTNPAAYVFVYDGNANADDVHPQNSLACDDCVPVRLD